MGAQKGQISIEIVVIAGVMMAVLFTIFFVNRHLEDSWGVQKQRLEAGAAADQAALAINRAAAWGDSARILYHNAAGPDVTNISVYAGRSLRAYYREGGFYSVPLATNQTNISSVPLNRDIVVENRNGTITISEVG